ncbi:MAG TPA: signal peptidase II [Alphaproteobacteria bacterium]|nr:signal peptidase II [Rhodospirillaceae bacterium]HRJ12645.1 signal peptidase II [Alphaproteobacteria bacterium]
MKISSLAQRGLILALIILIADQVSKYFVLQYLFERQAAVTGIEVTSFFNLVLVWNRGVSFGLFNHDAVLMPFLLMALAAVLVTMVLRWLLRAETQFEAIAFGLIIGGAIGNVIDRIRFGAVVDFLDFHAFGQHWPAFNVADSAIVVGAGIILYLWGLKGKKDA